MYQHNYRHYEHLNVINIQSPSNRHVHILGNLELEMEEREREETKVDLFYWIHVPLVPSCCKGRSRLIATPSSRVLEERHCLGAVDDSL